MPTAIWDLWAEDCRISQVELVDYTLSDSKKWLQSLIWIAVLACHFQFANVTSQIWAMATDPLAEAKIWAQKMAVPESYPIASGLFAVIHFQSSIWRQPNVYSKNCGLTLHEDIVRVQWLPFQRHLWTDSGGVLDDKLKDGRCSRRAQMLTCNHFGLFLNIRSISTDFHLSDGAWRVLERNDWPRCLSTSGFRLRANDPLHTLALIFRVLLHLALNTMSCHRFCTLLD